MDVYKWIGLGIGLVVLLAIVAELAPEAREAGDELNDSNICNNNGCFYNSSTSVCQVNSSNTAGCENANSVPLGSLFGGSGVVMVLIMAAVFIGIIYAVRLKKK